MAVNYKPELKELMNSVKKNIPTIQSESGKKNIYRILNNTYDELFNLIRHIPAQDLNKPLIPGKRSFRENLIHLLNVEYLNKMIITQALTIVKPLVLPLHAEKDIGKLSLFESLSTNELLSYFKLTRKILLKLLVSLSEEQWSRQILEKNKSRQESIYWRIRLLALHEFEHISIMKLQLY